MTPSPQRVAVVTGAARGIGAATVRSLCTRGYAVAAVDSCAAGSRPPGVEYELATTADLDALAAEFPGQVVAHPVDVTDPSAVADVVGRTAGATGRLDAVVAGAAVMAGGRPMWETPVEHLNAMWDVDVVGIWNTVAAAVPAMLAGPDPSGCRIVAIASAAGSHGLFRLGAYNVVKHAVVGLVRGLAADLVGTGVTAAAVSPGSTRTPMLEATAALYGINDVEELASHQLLQTILEPHEIAETIAFCCSIEGRTVNGSVVSADGGHRA